MTRRNSLTKGIEVKEHRALWATTREILPIRRPDPPNKGTARPPKRADFDKNYWDVQRDKRRFEYKPLDDAAYIIRFRRLCFHYHPAVAAILADDPTTGPDCAKRRIT